MRVLSLRKYRASMKYIEGWLNASKMPSFLWGSPGDYSGVLVASLVSS
jgi:hypothetical protein